jgi:hypothetical protein
VYDGRPAFKVRAVFISGVEQIADAGTDSKSGGGRVKRSGHRADIGDPSRLQEFGALMQPVTVVQKALFLEQVLRVTTCECDVVGDEAFDPPAPIKPSSSDAPIGGAAIVLAGLVQGTGRARAGQGSPPSTTSGNDRRLRSTIFIRWAGLESGPRRAASARRAAASR